jgi:hypothetical protein
LIAPIPATPSDNDHVTVTLSLNNRPLDTSPALCTTPNVAADASDSVVSLVEVDTWPPSDPPGDDNSTMLLSDEAYKSFLRDPTVKSSPPASLLSSGLWQVHPTPVLHGGGPQRVTPGPQLRPLLHRSFYPMLHTLTSALTEGLRAHHQPPAPPHSQTTGWSMSQHVFLAAKTPKRKPLHTLVQ